MFSTAVPIFLAAIVVLNLILLSRLHSGRGKVKFGPPLRLEGTDYAALARQVEAAVKTL